MVKSILDKTMELNEEAAEEKKRRGNFPEEDEIDEAKEKKALKGNKKRGGRIKLYKHTPESDKVTELMALFEPASPTKKSIRELRGALQELSKQRYPKGARKKKKKL